MPDVHAQNVIVDSGDTVSGDIALIGAKKIALQVPPIDSCQMFLQGNTVPLSAEYYRMLNPAGSGDWTGEVTVGSKMIDVSAVLGGVPRVRIELSAAQTDVRTFALAVKI